MRTAEGRRGFGELQISYSTRHTQHPYQGVGLRGHRIGCHLSHRAAAPSTCSGKTLFAKFPFPSFRRSVTFNSIQSVFPQFSASPQRYERTCGPNGECPPPPGPSIPGQLGRLCLHIGCLPPLLMGFASGHHSGDAMGDPERWKDVAMVPPYPLHKAKRPRWVVRRRWQR